MIKLILTVAGLLTISLTFAQKEIINLKSEKHQQIAGTKFFMVPPSGFTIAANFQGFQQSNSGATIFVIEIPGPFLESTRGFNEQGLKTQGVILKRKEDVSVNGDQGFFVTAEQFAQGKNFSKYILVFGDNKNTHMVNGTFPKEMTELHNEIRESMFSIVYESALTIDPLSAILYTIDTENTKLKFGMNMTGMLLYTVDGKVPTESTDKTSFIVSPSVANVQAIDKQLTAINRIKRMPYTDLKLDENKINEIEIDGLSGYEIVGEGIEKTNGAKELIYQVMLFTDNGYYLMIGTSRNDFDENLDLFKQVAKTFKRR